MLHPLNACHSRIATPNAQSDQSNWTNPIPLFDQAENFLDKNQNQKIKSWLWCVNFAIKLYDAWRFCQAQWCWKHESLYMMSLLKNMTTNRSSWLNCALRDDEAVFWASIGHYETVAVSNWWYWVSRGHSCLNILQKVEIWTGVTDAWLTHSLTHNFER